ncbi:phage terminase small subunit [Paraburkholderia sp. J8-2]|uniref:phage terminase small subunit n=1 Tax=Paraburkholderia sp. J8-2 TaxID=2805440 RepID=UPI002AB67EB5|nr:phage terminase small subunit [Paraburkholderia sp. J8-2]
MTMSTPARRHQARVRAEQAAASAAPGRSLAGASHYELMLAKLAADRRRLKALQSVARKVEVKREVLPEYADYVSGALKGGRGAQDDVLTTVMIWRVDAGDYAGALDIARYALQYGLTLPAHYERAAPAAIAEEFADAALIAIADGGTFDVDQLNEVRELTEAVDMHDQIRSKLYKALGLAAMKLIGDDQLDEMHDWGRAAQALQNLQTALQLNARAGVKQNIARLEKMLSDADGRRKAART